MCWQNEILTGLIISMRLCICFISSAAWCPTAFFPSISIFRNCIRIRTSHYYIEKLIMNNFLCRRSKRSISHCIRAKKSLCIILQVKIAENVIRLSRFSFEKIKIILPWPVPYSRIQMYRALQLLSCGFITPVSAVFPVRPKRTRWKSCGVLTIFTTFCYHFPGLLLFLFSFFHSLALIEHWKRFSVMQSTFNNIYQYLLRVSLSITLKLSVYFDMTLNIYHSELLVCFPLVQTAW